MQISVYKCVVYVCTLILIFALTACKENDHLLWVAKKANHTVFVAGVIHDLPEQAATIPRHVMRAFEHADEYVVEAINWPHIVYPVVDKTRDPGLLTLAVLADLEKKGLITTNDSYLLARTPIYYLDPIIQKISLRNRLARGWKHRVESLIYVRGLDTQLFHLAQEKKLKLNSLESPISGEIAWQKNCNTDAHHAEYLKSLAVLSTNQKLFKLQDKYAAHSYEKPFPGDIEFEKKMFAEFEAISTLGKLTLECSAHPRTIAWMPKLKEILAASTQGGVIFIAVGFGHLIYAPSLLQQLKDEGYYVQRIKAHDNFSK